jgi:drug/metabolite transporter (DMT)-like permease
MTGEVPEKNKQFYPFALALLSAALFGAAAPAGKTLLRTLPPYQLAGLLYIGAALGVLPLIFRTGGIRSPRRLSRRNRWLLLGAIVFGGILAPVLLLFGLRLASAASVSLWLPLELVATALLGYLLFREHLGARALMGLAGVVAASILLGIGEGVAGLTAGGLVAAACLCWGLDNNCTATIDGLTPSEITFWKSLTAGITNLVLGIVIVPWAASVSSVALALIVGALCYGTSIALYITAAQSIGATRGQIFFATAPFFGVALSAIALGESISTLQLAAAALVSASLVLVFRDQHGHWHEHEAMTHEHTHRHDDGHHTHTHPDLPASQRHSHEHAHEAMSHMHGHWPDLHHRHEHTK